MSLWKDNYMPGYLRHSCKPDRNLENDLQGQEIKRSCLNRYMMRFFSPTDRSSNPFKANLVLICLWICESWHSLARRIKKIPDQINSWQQQLWNPLQTLHLPLGVLLNQGLTTARLRGTCGRVYVCSVCISFIVDTLELLKLAWHRQWSAAIVIIQYYLLGYWITTQRFKFLYFVKAYFILWLFFINLSCYF